VGVDIQWFLGAAGTGTGSTYHRRGQGASELVDCAASFKVAPMINISASGMATGERILHHLKAFASDSRNMLVLPGFQAAATRGALLTAGAKEINIYGGYVRVDAEVVKLDSMSAHAHCAEIQRWLGGFKSPPRRSFFTHGESAAADELRRPIVETLGWNVHVPQYGESVRLQ
jgi:metallo-beta-lactamase family protein